MESPDEKKEKRLTKTESSFLKLFECPVCFERISPPVTVCINGHGVCRDCKKHLLTCPTCKASFSQYKNTMIDQIIEENTYMCKYNDRGCTVELKFHAIEDHEKRFCKHRTLKCALLARDDVCDAEVAIWEYDIHVLRNHAQELINFRTETHRTLDISEDISKTNILKNTSTHKILLENIKLDRANKKFYIIYQYIGLFDDSVFQIRFYNSSQKYKELIYRNLCVAVGTTEEDWGEKCLVLDPNILTNFATDNIVSYSIKIDSLPKKWYQMVKDKIANNPLRLSLSKP